MLLREGLGRLDGVASVAAVPDVKTGTAGMKTRAGRLLSPRQIDRHVSSLRIGARFRGVEATITGTLERRWGRLCLRNAGGGERIRLVPLQRKIQLAGRRGERVTASEDEKAALERLLRESSQTSRRFRVTGPLNDAHGRWRIEVRLFERLD